MDERKTIKIDAENKIVGRLASKIAVLLRGKQKPSFMPNKDIGDYVVVKNVVKIKFTGKKAENKIYYSHSGFIGGLKARTAKKLFIENPKEILRKAVYGMLPKNKLRNKQIKRLKIS